MDDSWEPGDPSPTDSPCQNDEGTGSSLSATGIFGTPSKDIDRAPDPPAQDDTQEAGSRKNEMPLGNAPRGDGPAVRDKLAEPIVHNIVLGGGSAAPAVDLLRRLRANSPVVVPASKPALGEPLRGQFDAPLPEALSQPGLSPEQSSESFTQLLRGWGKDSSLAFPAKQSELVERIVPSSDPPSSPSEFGLTGMRKTSHTDDREETPDLPRPIAAGFSGGVGGFTAILEGFSGNTTNSREQPPATDMPAGSTLSAKLEAAPSAFTKMLTDVKPELTNPAVAGPEGKNSNAPSGPAIHREQNPLSRPFGGPTSFTELLSMTEGKSSSLGHADNRPPMANDFPQRTSAGHEEPLGPRENQVWYPPTMQQREPSSGDTSLTQMIRTLEGPQGPPISIAYPSTVTPAVSSEAGPLFTETFPLEPPLTYLPPSNVSSFPKQELPSPVVSNIPPGPSEFSGIIDASKMRELQRLNTSASPPNNHVAPSKPLPAQSPSPFTSAPTNLHNPQPAPPVESWSPLHYSPPAVQASPMPPTPPLAVPPAQYAMGKMQQYLPLLLIMIIFLLIVILITVAFLLKR